ncbi:hypothetical protein AAHC03_012920 [Spirometra sp. Aus1]
MVYRGKRRQNEASNISFTKRRKVESQAETGIVSELRQRNERKFAACGTVLTLGSGDTGQLGLGPDITERSKPSRFSVESLRTAGLDDESSESFVQIAAGGMHTVCLTSDGRVFTFGCNDEGALGRTSKDASDEEDGNEAEKSDEEAQPTAVLESRPGLVTFPEPVTIRKVTAGDSHSAALDDDGRVWLWGTFRGSSGVLGLTKAAEICRSPVLLNMPSDVGRVVKIASGQDHLVLLTEDGRLFTMGCGEQGQLGRIAERFAKDGGRNGLDLLLQPAECRLRGAVRFLDVWAGGFATIARSLPSGVIYACGLNNYGQLALVPAATGTTRLEAEKPQTASEPAVEAEGNAAAGAEVSPQTLSESMLLKKQGPLVQFMLTPALGFDPSKDWQQFAISMHHTIALTASGEVYAVGRSDYGRLGFPVPSSVDSSAVPLPHLVQGGLAGRECQWVACGESCSFAVDNKGVAFSWGMGSSQQLAQADEDEDVPEPAPMLGKNLANRKTLMIDAGGQHTVLLAQDPSRNPPLADSKESTQKEVISASEPGPMDVSEDSEVLSKLPKEITQEDAGDQAHLIADDVPMAKIPKLDSDYKESPPTDDIELAQPVAATGKVEIVTPSDLLSSVTTLPIDVRSVDSSALASTAGATVNTSSLRSCSITSSSQPPSCDAVSSCSSNASAESGVVSSTHSTDGGGSSRLSSLEIESTRQPDETRRPGPPPGFPVQAAAATTRGACGMSICSTSSEPGGFPTDTTTSLGSVTASPIDMTNGETGAGGAV